MGCGPSGDSLPVEVEAKASTVTMTDADKNHIHKRFTQSAAIAHKQAAEEKMRRRESLQSQRKWRGQRAAQQAHLDAMFVSLEAAETQTRSEISHHAFSSLAAAADYFIWTDFKKMPRRQYFKDGFAKILANEAAERNEYVNEAANVHSRIVRMYQSYAIAIREREAQHRGVRRMSSFGSMKPEMIPSLALSISQILTNFAQSSSEEDRSDDDDDDDDDDDPLPPVGGTCTRCSDEFPVFLMRDVSVWSLLNRSDLLFSAAIQFTDASQVVPLGKTIVVKEEDGGTSFCLTVGPCEALQFLNVEGAVSWRGTFSCLQLDEAFQERLKDSWGRKVLDEMDAVKQTPGNDPFELLRQCCTAKTQFVDLEFPPLPRSLTSTDTDNSLLSMIPFGRPCWFLGPAKRKPSLFSRHEEVVDPRDVLPGSLGDFWLSMALAALAEFPELITSIFLRPEPDSASGDEKPTHHCARLHRQEKLGAYRLYINKDGWWANVLIDNFLPAMPLPCFARCIDPSLLWVPLVEKAFAKIHGSYAALEYGEPHHALEDLTGFPTYTLDLAAGDADSCFDAILRWNQRQYVVGVLCGRDDIAEEELQRCGLASGLFLSVTNAVFFAKPNIQLVQLRNVWGDKENWHGSWSDTSDLWAKYPEVAKACHHKDSEDCSLWMAFDDVRRFFTSATVCFVHRDWSDYRVQCKFEAGRPQTALRIDVRQPIRCCLLLRQLDPKRNIDFDTHPVMLGIYAFSEFERQHVRLYAATENPEKPSTDRTVTKFWRAREIAMFINLEPCETPYIVVPGTVVGAGGFGSMQFTCTLGVLCRRAVGEAFAIGFIHPPSGNFAAVYYRDQAIEPVEVPFQVRKGTFCEERSGTAVDD